MAKKKAAHHGGAWKVAYADFVTAMMALFMVLWISSQSKDILQATSSYFQKPFKTAESTSGVLPFKDGNKSQNNGETKSDRRKQIEMTLLNSAAADVYRLLHLDQSLENKPIDVQVTSDGLRVNVFDRATQPLFVGNTTNFTEWGSFVMQSLAWIIERHQFRVTVDGHARSQAAMPNPDYTAWELSTDRANAARRCLIRYAVDSREIERVSGYADTQPLPGQPRDSESNQRITIWLNVSAKPAGEGKLLAAAMPFSQ